MNRLPSGDPYFHARVVGDRVEVSGLPTCQLGHQLSSAPGKRPDGVFAGWSWNGARLEVRNDRYGFYPLYYFAGDRHIGLSTSLHTLLALGAPRDLDEPAISVFLRLGFFIADDTPFLAIRTVPPDADFSWRPGYLRVDGRFTLGKPQGLNRDEAIDAYIELFRRAVNRRMNTGVNAAVSLSGGRDSRHILLALCESGRAPSVAVTVRYRPPLRSEESEARALVDRLGVRHVILDETDSIFRAMQRIIARQNLCSFEHAWTLPMVDYLRARVGALYDGIGGDVLSAGLFLDEEPLALFESGRCATLAERLCGLHSNLSLLGPPLRRRFDRGVAHEHLCRELERHADAPNPIGSFYFWNRTRRCIAQIPYRLIEEIPLVFSPYLDHEVYDLLAGLPASMMLDHTFHTETIRRAYPHTADIPYAPKTLTASNPSPRPGEFSRQVLAYSLGRIPSRFVSQTHLLPRLARCLFDHRYAASAGWLGRQALYLWALEGALRDEG